MALHGPPERYSTATLRTRGANANHTAWETHMPTSRLALLAIALTIGATGCIGYEEELWINADGSGRMKFKILFSEMLSQAMKEKGEHVFSEQELAERFSGIEGITIEEAKTYAKAGNQVVSVALEFDSWDDLRHATTDDEDQADFWGSASVAEDDQGDLVYSRTVSMRTDDEGEEGDELAQGLVGAMFAGYSWEYTVHFPTAVVSANAADEDIDEETNTVTWELSLLSLLDSDATMTATLEKPSGI